jgi:hypothetical protein
MTRFLTHAESDPLPGEPFKISERRRNRLPLRDPRLDFRNRTKPTHSPRCSPRFPKPPPGDHPLIASTLPGLLGYVISADGIHTLVGLSLFFLPSLATVISADGIHTLGWFSLFFLLSLATVISADGIHTLGWFSLFFLLSLATVISADGIHTLVGFSLFFLLSLAAVIRADGLDMRYANPHYSLCVSTKEAKSTPL